MAEEVKYNNTLVSGRADETLTYTKYVKDESSGKSTKELLDEKVNKTDQLGTTQIADKAVTTEKLENESVTTDKLDAASVTTDKVADANITTSKLADSSVETEKINNSAVTTDKLNDGAVDNSKLSPNSVTSEKIKDESIITEKLNDRAVTTEKVEEKAVTNSKLGDQSVDGRVVREASLETKHFANESVTTEKIARKSITKDKLADNSVDASQVVDGSIGNAKLSPDSVTTEKIKDSSVTNEKVADDTLGFEKFDPELRKTIQAATGLPEDLSQMIQNVDKSIKQLHEKDTDLQSNVKTNQQQITANKSAQDAKNASLDENMAKLNTRDDQITETLKNISATGGASVASAVTYDNTTSQLTSANIQGAVDELQGAKIDKTSILQESGEAEDKVMSQKAVSDKLSDISKLSNEAIDGKYTITDFNNYSWNGSIVNIDSKYRSIKIPVTKGKKYTFESEGGAIQTTIKLSGNIVVGTNTGFIGYYRSEEVDSETKFLLVTFNNETISATVKVDSSVREQLSLLDTNIANVDTKATANKSQLNALVQESPNLFDASKNVDSNVFWGYQQQGTLIEENKYFVTYKIPVEKSTEYSINFLPTTLGENFAINCYTENDKYNGGSAETTFITGDATTYIRFCVTISMYSLEEFNNSFMLVKGDSSKIPSKYVKYGENVIGEVLEENISSKMKESLQEANNYTDSVVGRKREVHFSSKNIPIISLVYDDNSSNDDTLVKLADERGLKVTFPTIGSTNGFDSLGNKLKDWIVEGHGVISHGCTTGKDMIGINGKPFTTGDSMRFNCDKDAIKMLEGNISALDRYGLPHNGIAYFNQWDPKSPRLRNLVTSYYQYGITLSGDGTNDTSADIFNLKRYTTDNNTMLEGAKQLIDSAINNNVWLIFGGHMDRTATGSGNYSTMSDFIELLDYISKKVKSGQLISLNTDEAFFEFQSRKLVQNVIPNFEVNNSVTVGALRIKEGVVKVCTNSGTNAIYELIISGTPTEGTITIGIDNGNDKKDYTFNITSSMSLNDILILVQTALVSMSNNNQTYNIISNSNNHLTFSRAIKGECELPTINAGTTGLTLLFKEIKKGVNTTFN